MGRISKRLPLTWPKLGPALALTTGITILALWLDRTGWFQQIELAIYDWHIKYAGTKNLPDSPIIVVTIDEKDIQRWTYPIPDDTLAAAIEQLLNREVKVIGIDFFRDSAQGDRRHLKELAEDYPSLVFIEKALAGAVPYPEFLKDREQVGFADLKQDANGVIRRGLLMLWDDKQQVRYSLSLRLALSYLHAKNVFLAKDPGNPAQVRLGASTIQRFRHSDGAYRNVDDGGYQYLIDYKRSPEAFINLSFSDVIEGNFASAPLSNALVLIGLKAHSINDRHPTPLTTGWNPLPDISGVDIHAMMADQLIRGATIPQPAERFLSYPRQVALIFVYAALGALIAVVMERAPYIAVGATLLAIGLTLLISHLIFSALGLWVTVVPALIAQIVTGGVMLSYLLNLERQQIDQVMNLFGKFVSPEVAAHLWQQREQFLENGKPKAQRLIASVVMVDMKNFVASSNIMDPFNLMEWLNRYISAMSEVAMSYGGIVDDYEGDGIKINFGVPIPRRSGAEISEDAEDAARCALAMCEKVDALNQEQSSDGTVPPPYALRIGIHTGPVVVGSLGSQERMKYTTVGDVVNTAARLESFKKEQLAEDAPSSLSRILISEDTFKWLPENWPAKSLGSHNLKGKSQPLEIFDLSPNPVLYSTLEGESHV